MLWWQALLLGLLQGATELFPVSSLGHAVLLPHLLGWHYNQSDPAFVPYVVLLHLGTAGALLFYFRDEWVRLARGFFVAVYRGRVEGPDQHLAMMLLVGTIPAGLAGVFFESELKRLFASPRVAAAFLVVNGAIMAGGELLRRADEQRRHLAPAAAEAAYASEERVRLPAALAVGASQALALLPGISRSGVTMTTSLAVGLRHEAAARFSFLLATPVILAAGLLEVPSLASAGPSAGIYLAGAVLAGIAAYLSTRFLLRYFESGRLGPFAVYCVALGVLGLLLVH